MMWLQLSKPTGYTEPLVVVKRIICTVATDAGRIGGSRRRGMTEDEVVGWHLRLDGHEFEQVLGAGEGQGSLACYGPRGRQESDTTERLNDQHKQQMQRKRSWGRPTRRISLEM